MYEIDLTFRAACRRGIKALALFLILIWMSIELYAVVAHHTLAGKGLPELFGNFERVRDSLDDSHNGEEFSFAVVGDTRSRGTFERIAEQLRDEPLSFMVILGDFVQQGTEGHHDYLRAEASEFALPFPVFFVVGNHDVHRKKFPVSRFEAIYGPSNFFFVYRDCLFVIIRILDRPVSNDESIQFARQVLRASSGRYRKTFVLTHIPPTISSDYHARSIQGSQELVSLLDKYKVDYLIAGDYHGYARVKLRNTIYLVTGGGGGHLNKAKFGSFHHAMVLRVGVESVSERLLVVDRTNDFEDGLERFALAELYPWLVNSWVLASAINFALLCLVGVLMRGRSRRLTRTSGTA